MRRLVLAVGLLAVPTLQAGTGNPFDPRTYLDAQIPVDSERPRLTSKSIYRIDGRRYQKLIAGDDAVFLPSTGPMPELEEAYALCPQHLKLMREVLRLREDLPIESALQREAPAILALIEKCRQGRIKGPTLVIEKPDGAVVEIKAKTPEASRPADAGSDKD